MTDRVSPQCLEEDPGVNSTREESSCLAIPAFPDIIMAGVRTAAAVVSLVHRPPSMNGVPGIRCHCMGSGASTPLELSKVSISP